MSGRSVRIKKHILYSFGLKGISFLIGLIYVPLLIDYLDKERYGIWLTISSILLWVSFFDIGLGNGLRNKLAEAITKRKWKEARKIVSTTYCVIGMIFLALVVVFNTLNPFLNWNAILNTSLVSNRELYLLTTAIFSLTSLRFILEIIGKVYLSLQLPAVNNSIGPLSNILSLILVLLLIYLGIEGNLVILGIILSICPLIILILLSLYSYAGSLKFLRPSIKYIDLSYSKVLLGMGVKFFLIQSVSLIIFTTANILITHLFSPQEVTTYNIVYKYYQIPTIFISIIMTPFWSAATEAYFKNDYTWLKSALRKTIYIAAGFSIAIILMLVFSQFAFKFWIGSRVAIPKLLNITMAIFSIQVALLTPLSNFINGFGKLRLSSYLVLFSLILYFPLSILISKNMESSAGIVITTIILNSLSLTFHVFQVNKIIRRKAHGIWNQ